MRTTRFLKRTTAVVTTLTALTGAGILAYPTASSAVQGKALRAAGSSVSSPSTSPPTTTTTTALPPASIAPVLQPSPGEPPAGTLRPGDEGPRTFELQQRLVAMGYWLGDPDGRYGDLTVQAVTALQKVNGLQRDGVAGPAVTTALASEDSRATPRGGGDLIEIDKRRQVLFVVRDGEVKWILNVSTGTEKPYRVNGRTELADTPDGRWAVTRSHDGVKVGELGSIYRPRYFHRDGIAVHGYGSVPAFPASHGCVRVSKPAMDWIWSANLMPTGSPLWVY